MAYAFVQKKQNSISGGSSTTVASGASDSSVTAGNALFWIVAYSAASARTITMAGNSNTYVEVGNFRDTTTQIGIIWGYAENVNGGSTELTATFSAAVSSRSIAFAEYSGLRTDGTIYGTNEDAQGNQATPGTGTDGVTTGNITPGEQPGVLIGFGFNVIAGNTPNAGTSFTDRGGVWTFGGANNFARLEDRRITSTSAVAATLTATNNQRHLSAAIFLREVAAGGAAVTVTDDVSVVDTATAQRIALRTVDDLIIIVDESIDYQRLVRELTYSIALLDDESDRLKLVRVLTDDLSLLDSLSVSGDRIIQVILSEALSILDSMSAQTIRLRSLTDNVPLIDDGAKTRYFIRRLDEEITITEEQLRRITLIRLLQDGLSLFDAAIVVQLPYSEALDVRPRIGVSVPLITMGIDNSEIRIAVEKSSFSLGVEDA